MITIEDRHIDSAKVDIDYFIDDGVLKHLSVPIGEFKEFCESDEYEILNWNRMVFHGEEYVADQHGKISFELYCAEYFNDEDAVKFVEHKLKS